MGVGISVAKRETESNVLAAVASESFYIALGVLISPEWV